MDRRRGSGLTRVSKALVECPACAAGVKEGLPITCPTCNDEREVTIAVATAWIWQHRDRGPTHVP